MAGADMRGMALPDLIKTALEGLSDAQEAISVLAERIDPSTRADSHSGGGRSPITTPKAEAEDALSFAPAWLRNVYSDFREDLLSLSPEIEPRPAPLRDGRRRYEGFALRGRNCIYANFRKTFIRLMFELPGDHQEPDGRVVRSGDRDFLPHELRRAEDLDGARGFPAGRSRW
jgi:hypothetical protein